MLNVGLHCSHLHFIILALVQCLPFVHNLKQQLRRSEIQSVCRGFFYHMFIFSWTMAPATNTGILCGGYTVALMRFLYKDCFSLICEKLLLVRGQKSFPPAELKEAHRASRWQRTARTLSSGRAVKEKKKKNSQASHEFE